MVPSEWLKLTVEDTGCAMEERTRERILDPLFSTKVDDQSAGLGLSTVYGMVKQNGGQIEAVSRLGEGTTFTVLLPCARPIEAERTEGPGSSAATVLLAEDDPAERRLASRVLQLGATRCWRHPAEQRP